MKPIARSHLIAAVLSFTLLLATIVAFVVFVHRIHVREQRVLDARDKVASYEQNKRKLAEESVALEQVRDRVNKLEKNIVTEDTTPTLLSSIEAIGKNNGIDLTLTSVSATSAAGTTPAKLHIDFSASGSYVNIQHFMSDLLTQPFEAQITKFSLYLGTDAKGAGSWQLLAGMDILSF